MKSKYFREYFCSFSSKSYYFYVLGVSHLKATFTFQWSHHGKSTHESYLEYEDAEYRAYCQTSIISHTLVGNKIVDNSDVVGASPVGAAPTTSSFSI